MKRRALQVVWIVVVACKSDPDRPVAAGGSGRPLDAAASVALDAPTALDAVLDAPATLAAGAADAAALDTILDAPPLDGGPGGVAAAAACSADTDCVFVPADCCGCSGGGHNLVMSRTAAAKRPKLRCAKNVICIAMMTDSNDCIGVPACRAGRCVATSPRARPPTR